MMSRWLSPAHWRSICSHLRGEGLTAVVLCRRRAARLIFPMHSAPSSSLASPLIPPQRWADAVVQLSADWTAGGWQSVLCGTRGAVQAHGIAVMNVLQTLPVDLLVLSE